MPFSLRVFSNRLQSVIDQDENAAPDGSWENCLSNWCAGQETRPGKVAIDIRVIEKEH
jgi:hypothetical protein